jgi:hypothetical protein
MRYNRPEQGNRTGPESVGRLYIRGTTVVSASKPLKQLGFVSLQADIGDALNAGAIPLSIGYSEILHQETELGEAGGMPESPPSLALAGFVERLRLIRTGSARFRLLRRSSGRSSPFARSPSPLRTDRLPNCPMMKRVKDREGAAAVCCAPPRLFRRVLRARRRLGYSPYQRAPSTFYSLERERPPS